MTSCRCILSKFNIARTGIYSKQNRGNADDKKALGKPLTILMRRLYYLSGRSSFWCITGYWQIIEREELMIKD